jgi:hypothetical protein
MKKVSYKNIPKQFLEDLTPTENEFKILEIIDYVLGLIYEIQEQLRNKIEIQYYNNLFEVYGKVVDNKDYGGVDWIE